MFCVEGVALPLSPELSKEMVILVSINSHSKNGQILKITKKERHNYKKKKNLSLLPPSSTLFFKLVGFFVFKFLISFLILKSRQ